MASSPLNPKTSYRARSISLPSRSHPLTNQVEDQLYRLRASEATSSSPSSLPIHHNLCGLKDLYDSVDDLLQLPLIQQTLAHERPEKWVDEVLNGSLRLLDLCGTTRDVLSQMKECVTDLQSSLRRRKGESGLSKEVDAYHFSRKKVTKVISKCLGDLKKAEKKRSFSSLLDKSQDLVAMVSVLREVEAITLSMFESMLAFVSGPKAMSKSSGWSLVSKLMHNKRVACDEEQIDTSEMEKVDVALGNLIAHKSHKGIEVMQVQNAVKQLEALELSIQGLEEGLECVFRRLIKTSLPPQHSKPLID